MIMCKAPVCGKVKTRLFSGYSKEQATVLHQQMASTVIARANSLFADVWIASDDIAHPFFALFDLPLHEQGEGDLGQRMTRLLQKAGDEGFAKVIFLGTDSPHMAASRLTDACDALMQHDLVIGPVEDGGYDLIGFSCFAPGVFANIDWGSSQVFMQTLHMARGLALGVALLAVSFDVDTPDDVHRAKTAGWAYSE